MHHVQSLRQPDVKSGTIARAHALTMPSSERAYDRSVRRAQTIRRNIGMEVRDARLSAGLSQAEIGRLSHMSGSKVSRIEAAAADSVTLGDAVILCDAVGLELAARAYPGRGPTRDAPQARRLQRFLGHVGSPIRYRTEVLLPQRPNGFPERRAWDAFLEDATGETGVELEQRLYDVQSQTRRIVSKWRDSGAERILVVIADTSGNRRVLSDFPEYFRELPRLGTADVLRSLESGERPPTGLILF